MSDAGPRPELETVTSHDDVAGLGVPVDIDEIEATITVEREALTALIWAPADLTTAVVHALVGDPATRDGPQVIASSAPLFYLPDHGAVFARIIESVDDGAPLAAGDLASAFAVAETTAGFRNLLMELASPNPAGPWPLPTEADLPRLALAVVDQWHRRGYRALLDRMGTVLVTERSDDLGPHWEALSRHQRTAEKTRDAVRAALAAL